MKYWQRLMGEKLWSDGMKGGCIDFGCYASDTDGYELLRLFRERDRDIRC